MPPAAPRRRQRRRRLPRGGGRQRVEGAQRGRGLRLVSRAQIGEVGVRDVAGGVLEIQLAERGERHTLGLRELLALVGRQRQQRRRPVAPAHERPEREGGRRHGEQEGDHDGAPAHLLVGGPGLAPPPPPPPGRPPPGPRGPPAPPPPGGPPPARARPRAPRPPPAPRRRRRRRPP